MAGRVLFAVLMTGFLLTMVAWAATVPVTPASERPLPLGATVQPGDAVRLELTGWYGGPTGPGQVYWSTQEERWRDNGLPYGDVPPIEETTPIPVTIPAGAVAGTPDFYGQLLDRRYGEAFTTDRIPPEFGFGAWDEDRVFNRTLQTLDRTVERGDAGVPWVVIGFGNLSHYEEFWSRQGVPSLAVGTTWPCEGVDRWPCRVAARETAGNGTLVYERLVADGDTYSLASILGVREAAHGFTGTVRIESVPDDDRFRLVVDPVVGDLFQLREGFGDRLPRGTYRMLSVEATTFTADYSTNHESSPGLIGAWIWFDVVIQPRDAPAP